MKNKLDKKIVNVAVVKAFKPKLYGVEFVNELARLINLYGEEFKIDTPERLASFLAHGYAEVDRRNGRAVMRESMNYTTKRLKAVFRFMRHHPSLAEKYGRNNKHKANQKVIANIVYAHRLTNRGPESGDGWRYRGSGFLQTTGRKPILKGLRNIEEITGISLIRPDGKPYKYLLDTYTIGILQGMEYWRYSGMWKAKSFKKSIDIINYYTDSRTKRTKKYKELLAVIDKYSRV